MHAHMHGYHADTRAHTDTHTEHTEAHAITGLHIYT